MSSKNIQKENLIQIFNKLEIKYLQDILNIETLAAIKNEKIQNKLALKELQLSNLLSFKENLNQSINDDSISEQIENVIKIENSAKNNTSVILLLIIIFCSALPFIIKQFTLSLPADLFTFIFFLLVLLWFNYKDNLFVKPLNCYLESIRAQKHDSKLIITFDYIKRSKVLEQNIDELMKSFSLLGLKKQSEKYKTFFNIKNYLHKINEDNFEVTDNDKKIIYQIYEIKSMRRIHDILYMPLYLFIALLLIAWVLNAINITAIPMFDIIDTSSIVFMFFFLTFGLLVSWFIIFFLPLLMLDKIHKEVELNIKNNPLVSYERIINIGKDN